MPRPTIRRSAVATVTLLALTSCGSSGSTSSPPTSAPAPASTAAGTVPTTASPAGGDADLARAALLQPGDLGTGWEALSSDLDFPNSAELARTVPACADYAEIVFAGGSEHGHGVSAVLGRDDVLVFTYAVVFPDEAGAARLAEAVASPGFAECWARFNEVAMPELPFDVTSAAYDPKQPPALDVRADSFVTEFLDGSIVIGGDTLADTCVCVFAKIGRGVVEVHSARDVFTPEERSKVVQTAVDKLGTVLGEPVPAQTASTVPADPAPSADALLQAVRSIAPTDIRADLASGASADPTVDAAVDSALATTVSSTPGCKAFPAAAAKPDVSLSFSDPTGADNVNIAARVLDPGEAERFVASVRADASSYGTCTSEINDTFLTTVDGLTHAFGLTDVTTTFAAAAPAPTVPAPLEAAAFTNRILLTFPTGPFELADHHVVIRSGPVVVDLVVGSATPVDDLITAATATVVKALTTSS